MKSFTPLILIGICIAAYYIYLSPSYTEVKNLTATKNSYNDILLKAKDIIQKRDSVLASYNSLPQEDNDRLRKFLPDKFDNALMANHINSMANKYGMIAQDILISQQISADSSNSYGYKTHLVSFFVTGSYDNFISFLKDLEVNLNLVDITSLVVKSDDKTAQGQNLQFSFEFKTYSLK